MPAPADTRAPLPTSSRRAARAVLLAALGAGLTGLAVPGGPTAAALSASVAPAPVVLAREANPRPVLPARVASAAVPAAVPAARPRVRTHVHASRSRRAVTGWVRPVSAGVVSSYGPRWGRWHPGVDFGARYGAPIHAVGAGVVVGAGYLSGESGYGKIVLVRHAGGVVTAYAHMSRVLVHTGERVQAGDTLGLVGATGHVTGPHLHFEVRVGGGKINPVPWLRAHGVRV